MGKAPFDFITTKTSHPVDKGWSWVVMIAAFGSQFIVIGYQRSFGLMFVALQERYGYSSALLSAVNGTQSLTYSFATMLVMNYLLKKISVRTSCLVGVLLQAAGVVACSIYSDMISLIVCQGIFFGLGHSLLFCPTILILSQYFDKHRSIATAVATCGAGAGGIAFPYISRFLLNVFGLDGALLILGALLFNQSVFYALFQPIIIEEGEPSAKIPSQQKESISSPNKTSHVCKNNNHSSDDNSIPDVVVQNVDEQSHNHLQKSTTDSDEIVEQQHTGDSRKDDHLLTGVKADSNSYTARLDRLTSSQIIVLNPHVEKSLGHDIRCAGFGKLYSSQGALPSAREPLNQTLSRKSREYLSMLGGSTNGIHCSLPALMPPVHQQRCDGDETEAFLPTNDSRVEAKIVDGVDHPIPTSEEVSGMSLLGTENPKSDPGNSYIPAVMRLSAFWLIAVYIIGGIIAAGCPALYIPPLSKEKGLTDAHATFFLTISATTDFIGRIGSGLVLHFKLIDPCNLALIPLGLCSLMFNLTPLFNDFYSVLLLTLQYGFSSSMFWTLMSLVIIEVLGLANLGPAMGFYAVIYGITTSASFPIAGWLHDETGSYSSSFHYFGAMSFIAALALLIILLPRYRAKCGTLKLCQHTEEEN